MKRAIRKVGDSGDSRCQQDIRYYLKCAKFPIIVAFIFCNLSDRAGNLVSLMDDNDNIKDIIIVGNPGLPDHLGTLHSLGLVDSGMVIGSVIASKDNSPCEPDPPLPSLDAYSELENEVIQGEIDTDKSDIQKPERKLLVQPRTPKSGESKPLRKALGSMQEKPPAKLKMHDELDLAKLDDIAGETCGRFARLINEIAEAVTKLDPNLEDLCIRSTQAQKEWIISTCMTSEVARERFETAQKELGEEPIMDPSSIRDLNNLVRHREETRHAFIKASRVMHLALDEVAKCTDNLRGLQQNLNDSILEAESALGVEVKMLTWVFLVSVLMFLMITGIVLWIISEDYPNLSDTNVFAVTTILVVWASIIVFMTRVYFSDQRFESGKAFTHCVVLRALYLLNAKKRFFGRGLLKKLAIIEYLFDLCALLEAIDSAKTKLDKSLRRSSWKSTIAELRQRVESVCSEEELKRLEDMDYLMQNANAIIEELKMLNNKLIEMKKTILRVDTKLEDCLPGEQQELLSQKAMYEKERAMLKHRRRQLETRLKPYCGTIDPATGNIRCWFPELFLGAEWTRSGINASTGNTKQRTITDILYDLVKADLKLDVEEDEVSNPPQEVIGSVLAGRTSVQCKEIVATGELKVWKVIPWPTVDKDAEECLRRLKRALCNSVRVLHPNILRCEGAIIRSSSRDGHVESVILQYPFQRGGDLQHWLEEKPRSLGVRILALGKIADALYSMHRVGLQHRDIKPMNIVMSSIDDFAEPYLTDFEDSKLLDGTGVVSHRTYRAGGVGTPGFMAPELIRGVPHKMNENNSESTRRWNACDVYSFAITAIIILCDRHRNSDVFSEKEAKQILSSNRESLFQNLSSLLDVQMLINLLTRAIDPIWSNRPTMEELTRYLSIYDCTIDVYCSRKQHARNGILCPSGKHFICRDDFVKYIEMECARPIGDRVKDQGRFKCPDRQLCNEPHFQLEHLRMHLNGDVFEKVLQSEREIIQAEEAAASKQREDELRRALASASMKELKLVTQRIHITDNIATSRCPSCKTAWYDFSGCCALTCNFCRSHFCAFCSVTSFINRRGEVFANSQACHTHVRNCPNNPNQGDYFCEPQRFNEQTKRLRQVALREYLSSIDDPELLASLREDPAIRMLLSDLNIRE